MDVNAALAERGLAPAIQHGAHAAMGYGEFGYVGFATQAKIGDAGAVTSELFGGGGGGGIPPLGGGGGGGGVPARNVFLDTNVVLRALQGNIFVARGIAQLQAEEDVNLWISTVVNNELTRFQAPGFEAAALQNPVIGNTPAQLALQDAPDVAALFQVAPPLNVEARAPVYDYFAAQVPAGPQPHFLDAVGSPQYRNAHGNALRDMLNLAQVREYNGRLVTFDPEAQAQAELDALIAP